MAGSNLRVTELKEKTIAKMLLYEQNVSFRVYTV